MNDDYYLLIYEILVHIMIMFLHVIRGSSFQTYLAYRMHTDLPRLYGRLPTHFTQDYREPLYPHDWLVFLSDGGGFST